ncbi:MAG: class II aldolase/adducin family protein [Candidatus Pacebacteria bacterium]|nr:class II aldolase/adducin family protein [Candidatus Paceibacterota bacterium]
MTNKTVQIVGGGTFNHVHAHLSLAAPAYGGTARRLKSLCEKRFPSMDVHLHLTKMADRTSTIETNADLRQLALTLTRDRATKVVFWNPAVADFNGTIAGYPPSTKVRLPSEADGTKATYTMHLEADDKILSLFRQGSAESDARKDIFLVAFKVTVDAAPEQMYRTGLNMLKAASANLVLVNDLVTGQNMIVVPEEATYSVTTDRMAALRELVEMAYMRSHLTFTRSTVVAGDPVPWESNLVPSALRTVVDHCIMRGAYKKFRGVTAGHFAVKVDDTHFLTSRRKTDFNDMRHVGLVLVKTDGPDSVIAYGSKPSVGGQSQRIVFTEHADADCIVHFHCPKKETSLVPTVSQKEYECGSHECGRNTSRGLARFGNLLAVHLDQHGPNIVFSKTIDPQEVIDFIEANFDLTEKTGGYTIA